MKTLTKLQLCVFAAAMATSLCAHSYQGESIVLDPATGDYNITYWDDEPPASLINTTFVPATKIDPLLKSMLKLQEAWQIIYRYKVTNGIKSKQPIVLLMIGPVSNIKASHSLTVEPNPSDPASLGETYQAAYKAGTDALTTPAGWYGDANFSQRRGLWLGWNFENLRTGIETDGLQPGASQDGFGYSSADLPGIGMAQLEGNSPIFGYGGEGPVMDSAVRPEIERLLQNNFVTRPAAVPAIAVPAPFDAAVLLDRIQTQTHTWIGMKMLDATFSSQLDRYLTAAAEAYRHNQPKAAKEDINKVREMLKKEHSDMGQDEEHESAKTSEKNDDKKPVVIDRLAAKVLDFDLMYVIKRTNDND